MAYIKQNWENQPNRTTPLSAQRMNHLETQYDEAVSESKSYTDNAIGSVLNPSRDLVADLKYPIYIAHRGSPRVFPEHSIEGYRGSVEGGFYPEPDVRSISDGTLVCIHNNTTNARMNISKPIGSVTLSEWRNAKINPVSNVDGLVSGSTWGTPVIFEDFLDEFGGRTVTWPEIKEPADADAVISSVISRGLQKSTVLQSNNMAVVDKIVAAGIYALALTNTETAVSLKNRGVTFVGVSSSATNSYITSCKSQGLKVIAWTFNSKSSADAQLARGCDGVFTDDPWLVSNFSYPTTNNLRFARGFSVSGLDTGGLTPSSQTKGILKMDGIELAPVKTDVDESQRLTATIGGFGNRIPLHGTTEIELTVRALSSPQGQANNWLFGVYLGDSLTDYIDESPSSSTTFRLAVVRRDGRLQAYERRARSGSVSNLGVFTGPTPYASPTGDSGVFRFCIRFLQNSVTIQDLQNPSNILDLSISSWNSSYFGRIALGVTGGSSFLSDIKVSYY